MAPGRRSLGTLRTFPPELYGALFMGPLLEFGRLQVDARTSVPVEQSAPQLADAIWRSLAAKPKRDERAVRLRTQTNLSRVTARLERPPKG